MGQWPKPATVYGRGHREAGRCPRRLYSVFLWPEEFWDQDTPHPQKKPKDLEEFCILWSWRDLIELNIQDELVGARALFEGEGLLVTPELAASEEQSSPGHTSAAKRGFLPPSGGPRRGVPGQRWPSPVCTRVLGLAHWKRPTGCCVGSSPCPPREGERLWFPRQTGGSG